MVLKKTKKLRLVPLWFIIWLLTSCFILIAGGIADELSGKEPIGGVNAWAAAGSILLLFIILVIVWKIRKPFRKFILKFSLPLIVASVLIGLFFAEIDELINWPFNPLTPGISLFGDIILTIPMYLMAHLFWFYVLKKYKFTIREALYIGGISGALTEFAFSGAFLMLLFGPLILPFTIMIHGFHMVMPKLLLSKEFERYKQKDTKWKYVAGILLPILGTAIGVGIAFIIGSIFNIT